MAKKGKKVLKFSPIISGVVPYSLGAQEQELSNVLLFSFMRVELSKLHFVLVLSVYKSEILPNSTLLGDAESRHLVKRQKNANFLDLEF